MAKRQPQIGRYRPFSKARRTAYSPWLTPVSAAWRIRSYSMNTNHSELNPMVAAGLRAAIASNQRSLDILELIGAKPPRPDKRELELFRQFNFAAAVADLTVEKKTGIHKEIHDTLVARGQSTQHANSILVPWEGLMRADTVIGQTGGFLVESQTLPIADALRPFLVTGALGANVIPLPAKNAGNFNLPKISGAEVAYWLPVEAGATAEITESDIVYGQTPFFPHSVGVYSEISRQLNVQAPQVQAAINRDQSAVIGRAIDLASLYGTGTGGQPTGVANTAGVGVFSATALSLASLVNAQIALGNGLRESAGIATTLAVAGALRQRAELAAGSATLWQGSLVAGSCAGLPGRTSSQITAAQLIIGSWEYLCIAMWGVPEVSVNPYVDFKSGLIGVRSFLMLDVGVVRPGAFNIGSSFT
jgi:HK97 family phage major capsid protein